MKNQSKRKDLKEEMKVYKKEREKTKHTGEEMSGGNVMERSRYNIYGQEIKGKTHEIKFVEGGDGVQRVIKKKSQTNPRRNTGRRRQLRAKNSMYETRAEKQ